jgi:hypothetical protein
LRERVRDVAGSYTLGHGTILASGSPSMAAGLQGYSREANRRAEIGPASNPMSVMSTRPTHFDYCNPSRSEIASDAPAAPALEWAILKDALRRPLTPSERECVVGLVELHATFVTQTRASRVSSQVIKRTLGALARMQPGDAGKAHAIADGWTHAQIAAAMRRAGIRDGEALAHPTGEQVVSAAKSAIAVVARRAGRGLDDAEFSRAIIALWQEFGGAEWSPSAKDDFGTPIVRFAAAIFRAAGWHPCDLPAVAARLRSAA